MEKLKTKWYTLHKFVYKIDGQASQSQGARSEYIIPGMLSVGQGLRTLYPRETLFLPAACSVWMSVEQCTKILLDGLQKEATEKGILGDLIHGQKVKAKTNESKF